MSKSLQLTLKTLTLFVAAGYFVGCTGGKVSSSFGSSGTSGNSVSDIPEGSSNGITDPNFFYVGVDSENNAIAHVHKTGAFGTSCSIDPKTAAPLQDISCTVDVPEGELYHHGMKFVYNVPPDMCRFLRRKTYWYYNYPVGVGPKVISINRHFIDGALVNDYTCTVDGVTSAAGTCSPFTEVSIDVNELILTCAYTTTKPDKSVVNGCFGNYSLSVTDRSEDTEAGTDSTTTTDSESSWGGTIAEVLGGAARSSGWPTSSLGIPLNLEDDAAKGIVSANYSIPAPIDTVASDSNIEIANNFALGGHAHDGFISAATTTLPYFIDPIDDLDGSTIPASTQADFQNGNILRPGQSSYEFQCLDQAYEVLHRVRVNVREWDVYQDYVNYVSSKGATEVPDRSGAEGGPNCSGVTGNCNDEDDIDDFLVGLGGTYDTTIPAGISKRKNYFPKLLFQ